MSTADKSMRDLPAHSYRDGCQLGRATLLPSLPAPLSVEPLLVGQGCLPIAMQPGMFTRCDDEPATIGLTSDANNWCLNYVVAARGDIHRRASGSTDRQRQPCGLSNF